MIREKIGILHRRGKPELKSEYESDGYGRKKLKYKYYICDYCGALINMNAPKSERTGGTMTLSYILTKSDTAIIACCNKCVNSVLAEFTR